MRVRSASMSLSEMVLWAARRSASLDFSANDTASRALWRSNDLAVRLAQPLFLIGMALFKGGNGLVPMGNDHP